MHINTQVMIELKQFQYLQLTTHNTLAISKRLVVWTMSFTKDHAQHLSLNLTLTSKYYLQ